ncbi:MAG: 30S ribosomal protein S10 [Bacilli bacterium]|nr:30S ribosomal protein S10 [Bacilli bacterium]
MAKTVKKVKKNKKTTVKKGAPQSKKSSVQKKQNKMSIMLHSYDHKLLDLVTGNISKIIQSTNVKYTVVPFRTKKKVYTILRAPFKYKDDREQFEYRKHRRLITIYDIKEDTINSLRNISLPSGVDIQIKT